MTATTESTDAAEADVPNEASTNDTEYQSVAISGLRVGRELKMPIHDERGVLLLAEGKEITESFLDNLRSRSVEEVRVHQSELPRIYAGEPQGTSTDVPTSHEGGVVDERNECTDELDERTQDPAQLAIGNLDEALSELLVEHGTDGYNEELKEQMVERQEEAIQALDEQMDNIRQGIPAEIEPMLPLVEGAMGDLVQDVDLFNAVGINPYAGDYPARHSMHTSLLAISIGTRLHLDAKAIRELGLGCLLHDVGMLRIKPGIHDRPRRLSRIEFLEIMKHPIRAFDMVQKLDDIPSRTAFIVYQMHERYDGSGYPRGRKGNLLHFFSRIASVADAYIGMVSPRPYRPAILPHKAAQDLLNASTEGIYDPLAVRALLETISLYPIGSYVALNDGRVGQVLRANGVEFDRPVVLVWNRTELEADPETIDLLETDDVYIESAIPSLLSDADVDIDVRPETRVLDMLDLAEKCIEEDYLEARKYERRQFRQDVIVYSEPVPGRWRHEPVAARNLSAGGLSVVVTRELTTGTPVRVAIEGATGGRVCMAAICVRCEAIERGFYECGFSFRGKAGEPDDSTPMDTGDVGLED